MPRPDKGRHLAHSAETADGRDVHFRSIPLELREHVYQSLADEAESETLLNLLLVNHQISREAKPFLFKRNLVFEGQHDLFAWLREVKQENLRHVVDISFQLHDIKPDEIIGALGKRLRQAEQSNTAHAAEDNPYHEACDQEIKKIADAFSLMPNVKSLSIFSCEESDPRPSYGMLVTFSKMLACRFSKLQTLQSKESSLPLNFVTNKPKLRRLQVPSQTPSSPADVAAIFERLPIKSLSIYGASKAHLGYDKHRIVLAEMLSAVQPLKSMTLFDSDLQHFSQDVAHDALVRNPDPIGKHLRSLETLKILVEYTPDIPRASETLSQLQRFLKHAKVSRLEMAEPLIFTLDHRLPSSIRTFVIRLDRPSPDADVAERMENLLDQFETLTDELKRPGGSRLPNLREIIIVFEADEEEEDIEDLEELDQARDLFQGTGIRLKWMIGEPDHSI